MIIHVILISISYIVHLSSFIIVQDMYSESIKKLNYLWRLIKLYAKPHIMSKGRNLCSIFELRWSYVFLWLFPESWVFFSRLRFSCKLSLWFLAMMLVCSISIFTKFELDRCANNGDLLWDRQNGKLKHKLTETYSLLQYRIESSDAIQESLKSDVIQVAKRF